MDQELLVEQQIDAGAKFLSEFGKIAPVKIAYWSQGLCPQNGVG